MKNYLKIHILKAGIALSVVVTVVFSCVLLAHADMVTVYDQSNPELQMVHLYDESLEQWIPEGTIAQSGDTYNLVTNSWAFWLANDYLDFACRKTAFNTGNGSVLTVETVLQSWDAAVSTASAGIMIRDSLAANSAGVFLCVREGTIYMLYRKSGNNANAGIKVPIKIDYPVALRMVANKSKKTVAGYYKIGSNDWVSMGIVPYTAPNQVYSGLSAHSADKSAFNKAVFKGLSVVLTAPEGYEVDEDDGSNTSSDSTSSEQVIKLPEDLPVTSDVLLSETFTDDNLFNTNNTVTDPTWTVRAGTPNIITNDMQTNRYLKMNSADQPLMMTAGSQKWTDYCASVNITFSKDETVDSENNYFTLILRHRSVVLGGSFDYGITLCNKFKNEELLGQYLQLNYRDGQSNFVPTYTTLVEAPLAEASMVSKDVAHNIKVEVIDNVFNIYFDGTLKISYSHVNNYLNLTGGVGIYGHDVSATIDNLFVKKLYDPLGGDYDNQIGGRFDQPVPDYLKEKYGIK